MGADVADCVFMEGMKDKNFGWIFSGGKMQV